MIRVLQLALITVASTDIFIKVDSFSITLYQPHNTLTCYTCPDKGNNHECNRWAPEKFCPTGHTVCETVHRFHHHSGRSVFVEKRCAKPTECTMENIGCQKYNKHHRHLMECRSCCTESYCNRAVPYNMTTALELSLSLFKTEANSGLSLQNTWSLIVFTVTSCIWIVAT